MKRHLLFNSPVLLLILAITGVLQASCNKEEISDDRNQLTLVSSTDDPVTRATVNNVWSGGEQVQVSIDNGTAISFIAHQRGEKGELVPVSPLFWQNALQSITARAWYPGSWTFPVDQRAGLQPADFIFASTVTGITVLNYTSKPLVFQHRTAKVTVNLKAGTDINNVNGATVAFRGYTAGIPNTTHVGNGVISGATNGWILPQNTNEDTYTALLIPQDNTGTQFVKITLGGNVYSYIPAAGQAVLQQGMAYTYNITVYMTRINVEVVGGIVWKEGNEYNITPTTQ